MGCAVLRINIVCTQPGNLAARSRRLFASRLIRALHKLASSFLWQQADLVSRKTLVCVRLYNISVELFSMILGYRILAYAVHWRLKLRSVYIGK